MPNAERMGDSPAASTVRTSPAGWSRLGTILATALLVWLGLALPAGAQEEQDGADATPGVQAEPAATDAAQAEDDVPAEPSDLAAADVAGDGIYRVVEDLNLRTEPSPDAEILAVMPAGSSVTVAADAEPENDFLPVTFEGDAGWTHAAYVVDQGDNLATVVEGLNLRAEPNLDAEVLLVMPAGAEVRVFGQAADDEGATWNRVRYEDVSGWAAAEFLATGSAGDEGDQGNQGNGGEAAAAADLAGQERVALDDLNLRAGPSAEDEILRVIPAGGVMTLTGEGWENGFVTATFDGTTGWVAAEFIARPDELEPATAAELSEGTVAEDATTEGDGAATDGADLAGQTRVTLDDLNLRAGPSADDEVLLVIPAGATVTLTAEGAENGYVTVEYEGTAGWVAAEFLGE